MKLDKRLQADSKHIYELGESTLLLMNNSLVDWFMLVPRCDEIEFTKLTFELQTEILKEINLVAQFIQGQFSPDKLNIATLGNVVSQMHIHVIGRKFNDPYWPAPVWGQAGSRIYTDDQVTEIKQAFERFFATNDTQA
ncbi:MAG: HIT domain-containing protein [Planctomycetes bacterium]|nr:HIT domain-containing protein [Planctomycetota bacterium]MCH9725258.1 HIT domain-containing protein [Planctomycetota bacterium]MCH9779522.1 HIT domain-containing protein [Planctomycetota bacterium]MCH9791624.1 HIT domain-containing protein [Planctomycetota bacterium]